MEVMPAVAVVEESDRDRCGRRDRCQGRGRSVAAPEPRPTRAMGTQVASLDPAWGCRPHAGPSTSIPGQFPKARGSSSLAPIRPRTSRARNGMRSRRGSATSWGQEPGDRTGRGGRAHLLPPARVGLPGSGRFPPVLRGAGGGRGKLHSRRCALAPWPAGPSSSAAKGLASPLDEAAFFRAADPWGFILFARNVETPDQVRA
jgi:hypothetical protein